MDKKSLAYKVYISVGIFCVILAIFWLSVFIFYNVFHESQITFQGDKNPFGGYYKSFSASPYILLLFPIAIFTIGLHLLFQVFDKPKIAKLFFSFTFLALGSFFLILFKFSDLLLSSFASVFVFFSLTITIQSIKELINIKNK